MGVAESNRRGGGAGSSPAAGSFRVTIPSDFSSGRDVQERIMAEVERHAFGTDSAFAIRIALEEAMVNAIKHGNRLDPAKKVHVECKVTPRRAEIIIEDEGPGFDRSSVPDPTDATNLEKLTGRGILLIEAYMTRVEYSNGGRRVKLIRHNQAAGGLKSA